MSVNETKEVYIAEWTDFCGSYVKYKRRRELLQATTRTSQREVKWRIPWQLGESHSWVRMRKLVYEKCALHFSSAHEASRRGDAALLEQLIAQDCTMSMLKDSSGRLPIHQAVVHQQLNCITVLLRQDNHCHQLLWKDNSDYTPFHYVLRKLDLKLRRGDCTTPKLVFALQLRENNRDFNDMWLMADRMLSLVKAGSYIPDDWFDFDLRIRGDAWDACRCGNFDRLRRIQGLYKDRLHAEFQTVLSLLNWTLLHEACSGTYPSVHLIRYLLTHVKISLHVQDQSGCTALHVAARRHQTDVCQVLVHPNATDDQDSIDDFILIQDVRGRTALHWSIMAGTYTHSKDDRRRMEATTLLLAKANKMALYVHDDDGRCPFDLAVICGNATLVHELLSLGADPTGKACLLFNIDPSVVVKKTSGYRAKAGWAPCARIFRRGRTQDTIVCHANADSLEKTKPLTKLDHLMQWLERVRGKTKQFQQTDKDAFVGAVGDKNCDKCEEKSEDGEQKKFIGNEDAETASDRWKLGCRTFGAVCDLCKSDEDEVPIPGKLCISLTPLAFAIKSIMRKSIGKDESDIRSFDRLEIVKTLLCIGGYDLHDGIASITTALQQACSVKDNQLLLSLVELLLKHFQVLVGKRIFKPFISDAGIDIHFKDTVMCHILREGSTARIDESLPIFLFIHRCFKSLQWFINSTEDHGTKTIVSLTRAVCQSPMQKIQIRFEHVQFVFENLKKMCEVQVRRTVLSDILLLAIRNETKKAHMSDRGRSRMASIIVTKCVQVITASSVELRILEEMIKFGFLDVASALLDKWALYSNQTLLLNSFLAKIWSCQTNRLQWPNLETTQLCQSIALKAIDIAIRSRDTVESNDGISWRSLLYACALNLPTDYITTLLEYLRDHQPIESHGTTCTDSRVGGMTIAQWIVMHDRQDLVPILSNAMTKTDANIHMQWLDLVFASMQRPRNDSRRTCWLQLLFEIYCPYKPLASSGTASSLDSALAKKLKSIIARCDSTLLLDYCLKSGICIDGHFVSELVQWNAIQCVRWIFVQHEESQWDTLGTLEYEKSNVQGMDLVTTCRLLGYHEMAGVLESKSISQNKPVKVSSDDVDGLLVYYHINHGTFRILMETNENSTSKSDCQLEPSRGLGIPIWAGGFRSACSWDRPDLLSSYHAKNLHMNTSSEEVKFLVKDLVCACIEHTAVKALRWLLEHYPGMYSDIANDGNTGSELLLDSSRHPSNVHAEMTRVLLEYGTPPGRLSGDGIDTTLLHRVACFTDPDAACHILESLLIRPEADVNVRDGFGNSPLSYALVAGQLETACYLMLRRDIRLEAEYEGQSWFYDHLTLLPSYCQRYLVQTFLISKRQHAFLHCTVGSDSDEDTVEVRCTCQCFEMTEETDVCGFCGHALARHVRVPTPSWFLDQYGTYEPLQDTSGYLSETEVEDTRGRLGNAAMQRIALVKYARLVNTFGLSLALLPGKLYASDVEEESQMEVQEEEHQQEVQAPIRLIPKRHTIVGGKTIHLTVSKSDLLMFCVRKWQLRARKASLPSCFQAWMWSVYVAQTQAQLLASINRRIYQQTFDQWKYQCLAFVTQARLDKVVDHFTDQTRGYRIKTLVYRQAKLEEQRQSLRL